MGEAVSEAPDNHTSGEARTLGGQWEGQRRKEGPPQQGTHAASVGPGISVGRLTCEGVCGVACGWARSTHQPPGPSWCLGPAAWHLGYLRGLALTPSLCLPAPATAPPLHPLPHPRPPLAPQLLICRSPGQLRAQAWSHADHSRPHQPRCALPAPVPFPGAAAAISSIPNRPPRLPVSFQALVGTVAIFLALRLGTRPQTPRRHPRPLGQ